VLALNGGGERWASLCSIIETCKLYDVAQASLRDVDGQPVGCRDERLP
jgi:transposase